MNIWNAGYIKHQGAGSVIPVLVIAETLEGAMEALRKDKGEDAILFNVSKLNNGTEVIEA